VGRVPYLGFFREQDAQSLVTRMRRKDLDVYARTAGAYSTLGWFRDPILVPMLEWGTFDLAETVLHELAHATVWIRGRVDFNESFASFVGEEAAFRYLEDRYGADSDIVLRARADFEDVETWRKVLQQLYNDLDAVYTHDFLTSGEKQRRKAEIFSSLGKRVASAEFHHPERYLHATSTGQWNNARLVQFKTYNANRGVFETLLAQEDGDLLSFMKRIGEIAQGAADPFEAIESATQP
jgi:predicted aminopeptidase